ncbi:hypothetical protein BB029_18860 [Pseudomonas sp. S3E12]|nr:hypothetical protein BB029_18860 [Pseudomonas sp. S3E12]
MIIKELPIVEIQIIMQNIAKSFGSVIQLITKGFIERNNLVRCFQGGFRPAIKRLNDMLSDQICIISSIGSVLKSSV